MFLHKLQHTFKEICAAKRILFCLFLWGLATQLTAQTNQDWNNGYYLRNDSAFFVFSNTVYGVSPGGVVLTGDFRNWSQDLSDNNWKLKKIDANTWQLALPYSQTSVLKAGMSFKFRTSDGKWMAPPAKASNAKAGNLVFLKDVIPFQINASLLQSDLIEVNITGLGKDSALLLLPNTYLITNAENKQIPLVEVRRINTSDKGYTLHLFSPPGTLDKRRPCFLEIPSQKIRETVTYDAWYAKLKSNKALGANVSNDLKYTDFRVFAPRATALKLYIYQNANDTTPLQTHLMNVDEMGVWECRIQQNLQGYWYDFTVHGYNDPGNNFYESKPFHVSDPYARVSNDSYGKCMVALPTRPASPLKNGRPLMENLISYEMHVVDFTDLLPIDSSLKGTFDAITREGLVNKQGKPVGFDYLTKLGVNTVHLMPVQEILHWPKAEWYNAFNKDPFMIEQGVNLENYDWGYRTSHSFALETRYRKPNTLPGAEREQFRNLVQKFHDKNMAVIVDFVFNHTADDVPYLGYLNPFHAFDKQYYYRTKNLECIGDYGNETKSENRYMVQRWIADQCLAFIHEFGVDGFRIDLAGLTDRQTLIWLKSQLPDDIILYGEPWIDSKDPNYNNNPEWHWYKESAPICYFNDDTRNTYKGPVFELNSKDTDRGWAGGNENLRDDVKKALTCSFPGQLNINSGINYLDIHDNFALADQFAENGFDGRYGVDEVNYKIAAVLLFTTPGPIVMHGGSEMMRSKGMAPLKEIEKVTPSGTAYFHGKRDTYNMRAANRFVWSNVGVDLSKQNLPNPNQEYKNANYQNMINYWQSLMEFRKTYLFNLQSFQQNGSGTLAPANAYTFIEPADKKCLGYIIEGKVFVMLNTGNKAHELEFELPKGKWKCVGNTNEIALKPGFAEYYKTISGGKVKYIIEPYSISIWIKE